MNSSAIQETGVDPWVRKIPWRREWLPTLLLLPGEYYGQSTVLKNLPAKAGDARDVGLIPGSGRFPWSRKWQTTLVLLTSKIPWTEKSGGYSPWGHKESDMTKHDCVRVHPHTCKLTHARAHTHTHTHTHTHGCLAWEMETALFPLCNWLSSSKWNIEGVDYFSLPNCRAGSSFKYEEVVKVMR